jgi:calcium-dependent protein kinase
MGEECSACRSCVDQHEIRSNETHLTGTHIISNNNKNNITKINKNNNKDRIIQPKIIVKQNHNNSQSQNKKSKYNIKRKEGRKSTLDSISFNEQKKSEFEEELRISLCSLKERKNSSGYCSSGGGSFLSDDESSISISNKLFINEISEYLPSKKYKILSKLGSGSFGNVYLAQNRYTKEKVAMKIIKKANKDLLSDGEIKDEIDILKTLEHPDIVRIIESFNTKDSYVLVTEYCEGGELYDQVKNQLSETQIAVIFKQLLSGLAYLHSNNIVHRDLKLENILIQEIEKSKTNGEELFNIKIIDFGTARIFSNKKKPQSIVGSSYYIAPEVLRQNYNKECDLWSVGVILYMFIVGHAPFDGCDDEEITGNIQRGVYKKDERRWKKASKEVKDLIQKLLIYNPKKRLTALEALKHPWFKLADSNILYDNVPKNEVIECIRNLLTYNISSKLEELVLAYIIHSIPRPRQAKSAIKLFKLVNEVGDGKLQKKELKKTLLLFVTEEFLDKYDFEEQFWLIDGDKKGYINYEEFLRACLPRKKILTDKILKYAFSYFDPRNTGYITKKKMKSFFGNKVDDKTFKSIFDEIDSDKDGKLNFKDFKAMLLY